MHPVMPAVQVNLEKSQLFLAPATSQDALVLIRRKVCNQCSKKRVLMGQSLLSQGCSYLRIQPGQTSCLETLIGGPKRK